MITTSTTFLLEQLRQTGLGRHAASSDALAGVRERNGRARAMSRATVAEMIDIRGITFGDRDERAVVQAASRIDRKPRWLARLAERIDAGSVAGRVMP